MFNSNFIQKCQKSVNFKVLVLNSQLVFKSVSFKQPVGKNIANFFTKMPHPASLKQSYDSACSHTSQQIVTGNTNTMSTSSTHVFGKRPIVIPTSSRTLKKILISVPNSKINIFKLSNTDSPLLSSCQKTVKCKANSFSFPINTMQRNKAVDSTSSNNSLCDTNKFQ